ncbi:MAG: HAD family hydrolase [Saprospirales bacterium]|nr:MAG: HAD family hydrolase [Saprospirales bacterium]
MSRFIPSRNTALFLDRDGVINKRKKDGYITSPDEFSFLPGVANAISRLNKFFGKTLIITNQQGVGKGLMTESDLEKIHQKMIAAIESEVGHIDKIYHAPQLESANCIMRKPHPGMIHRALRDFPEISLEKSWLVGDTTADLELAQKMGISSVFLHSPEEADSGWEDFEPALVVGSLAEFADIVCE